MNTNRIEAAARLLLDERESFTSTELSARTGLTRQGLHRHLARWVREGKLLREGNARGTLYRMARADSWPSASAPDERTTKQQATGSSVEAIAFVVDERPFAVWTTAMQRDNLEFLEGMDSEYFEYVAEKYVQDLDGDDAKRAALAMRSTYSHAMETFFAFLCAALQAPGAPEGWMLQ